MYASAGAGGKRVWVAYPLRWKPFAPNDYGGALQDVAPTLLALMGLPKPPEMTGHSLIRLTNGSGRRPAGA